MHEMGTEKREEKEMWRDEMLKSASQFDINYCLLDLECLSTFQQRVSLT